MALALLAAIFAPAAHAQEQRLYLSDRFSETADPAADIRAATALANGRHILLDVGGDWCPWCRMIDRAIQDDAQVRAAYVAAFIIVKINYSRAHPNAAFLSQYPDAAGYPHFFVLDQTGAFVASQPTDVFEEGRGYNREKLLAFARTWAPR
jgi:thiol:disulfide interchange protein